MNEVFVSIKNLQNDLQICEKTDVSNSDDKLACDCTTNGCLVLTLLFCKLLNNMSLPDS